MATTAPEPVLPILAPPRPEPARPAPSKAQANANAVAEPAAAAPAPAAAAAAPPVAAPAAPAPAATATTTEPAAGPVRSFAELSPEARAQLPAVNVSGSTYSKNPALRMLIVNGKVLQEGQEIAPGFKLETIGQRNAVLNHNGVRYSIGY
jgi:general secretion pathway protein B